MNLALRLLRPPLHRLLMGLVRALAWLCLAGRRRGPVRRSLWAGTPILTLAINARAERLLGVQADSLVYYTFFITDAFTYDLSRLMRGRLAKLVLPYCVLLWALLRYQRFHFFANRGLLWPMRPGEFPLDELRLLRRWGKQVYFWTYGGDVRTRDRTRELGEPNCCTECESVGTACVCDPARAATNYQRLAQYATAVFSMGDMAEYTPGSRNDLFYWPVDLEADAGRRYVPQYPAANGDRPLRVVHAPNHRQFKGTHFLIEAVERLKAQGVAVELVLVERVPNEQALEIYRTADVIFDQCLVGFHGYFAHEAMAMGKPVLCFIRKSEYLLAPDECPIVNCRPETLAGVLRELAGDRRRLHDLGRRGRRYIETHYSLQAFAERLGQAYASAL